MNKEPRTWTLPPAPEGVNRLHGTFSGQIWTARTNHAGRIHWNNGQYTLTWSELLAEEGEVVEVVETELEAAVRRLREAGYANPVGPVRDLDDIAIVLAHVLNGGTI